MSKNRRLPSINDVYPRRVNERGESLCRYCGKVPKPPKKVWCNDECVYEALLRTNTSVQRRFVYKRDKGVCQICSVDIRHIKNSYITVKKRINRQYKNKRSKSWKEEIKNLEKRKDFLYSSIANHHGGLWEMDHIIPISEGGSNDVDNLRVLCVPCHKKETSKLASRRARRRKKDKEV